MNRERILALQAKALANFGDLGATVALTPGDLHDLCTAALAGTAPVDAGGSTGFGAEVRRVVVASLPTGLTFAHVQKEADLFVRALSTADQLVWPVSFKRFPNGDMFVDCASRDA